MQEKEVEVHQIAPSLFVLTSLTSTVKHRKEIIPQMKAPVSWKKQGNYKE